MFRNSDPAINLTALIKFSVIFFLLSAPVHMVQAQQADDLIKQGNILISKFKSEGYEYIATTDRSINNEDAIGLRRTWIAGHKYIIVALIKDCASCLLFVRADQVNGPAFAYLTPEFSRSPKHTIAFVALPPEPRNLESELTFSIDSTRSYYTTVMLFESVGN